MNYPMANIFSKRALRLCAAILALVFCGCATQTANNTPGGELQAPSAKQTISKITTSDEGGTVTVTLAADQKLAYTAIKQAKPLAVVLYFPETRVDQVAPVLAPDPNDVISAIRVAGKDVGGTPARVEILLKKDVRYDVDVDDRNLRLVFSKTAAAAAPVYAAAPASEAERVATRFEQIEIVPQKDRVDLLIRADGPIDDYKTFSIETPPRMVFDLPKVTLAGNKEQNFAVKSPLVSQVRVAGYPDRTRIVLDTEPKYFKGFSAKVSEKGLTIQVVDPAKPVVAASADPVAAPAAAPAAAAGEPAWVNRIDFSSEADGRSALIIGTTQPVKFKVAKAGDKTLDLNLFDTRLPVHRKRPLITTRFESAVDRILPVQTQEMTDRSLISIELRENVPYFVEQKDNLLTLRFEKSAIAPRPLEAANLPGWQKALTEGDVRDEGPTARAAAPQPAPAEARTAALPAAPEVTWEELEHGVTYAKAQSGPEAYDLQRLETKGSKLNLDIYTTETVKRYTGEKISLDFYETDIKNVFRILREVSGKNFAIDKDVSGQVTLSFEAPVPWDQVLDLVLKMNQLGQVYEGDIIRIATLETMEKEELKRQDKLIALQRSRKQEDHITAFIPVNYTAADSIRPHVEVILTKAVDDRNKDHFGKISVDTRNNLLVVTDAPTVIKRAKEIVRKLDTVTPQVIIEARIVEANSEFTKGLGIEWGFSGNTDSNTLGGLVGYNTAVNLGALGGTLGTAGISFQRLFGSQFTLNAQLNASETQGDLRIISSPKVVTVDNTEARISQGQEIPYFEESESGGTTVKFKEVNLELIVTPHITNDDRVVMKIRVLKKDVAGFLDTVPFLDTKEAVTEMLVNDGETVVIGGVNKDTSRNAQQGIPYLNKIPMLEWLFGSKFEENRKEELLIFISPKIVRLAQR
ncbi:MAG TPA: type IV pilus secretin PilQ [Desulfobacterales bacterium]|nr:type IV pilus secretin PilQ [Desulfobacterales bacterium]